MSSDGLVVLVRHAGAEQQGVATAGVAGEPFRLVGRDAAARRLIQPDHPGLRHRHGEVGRDAAAGRDLHLARAGPKRADAAKQRRARHLHAARHHQHPAAPVLVLALLVPGERHGAQQLRRDRRRTAAHRAPTETSGSAVTGAPSSSSGAAKL